MSDTAVIDAPDTTTAPPVDPAPAQQIVDPTTTNPPAPGTPAAPSTPAYLKPDGSFEKDWHLALGDEFAPHAAQLATFKDVKGLAKSLIHFRGTGPAYPGAESTPDDIARFRQLAQVPETPDAYGIAPPETLPDGVTWDPEAGKKLAEIAHQHHVPAPAMKALVAAQIEIEAAHAQAQRDTQARAQAEAKSELIAEWRGDFEKNTSIVRHLMGRLAEGAGITADSGAIEQLANIPGFAKIMLQVSKLTAEDHVRAPAGMGDLRTPRQRADEIMSGKDSTWGEKYQNGDRQAMTIVADLLKQSEQ